MSLSEQRIVRGAFGWFLVCAAAGGIGLAAYPDMIAAVSGKSYLSGVLSRSLEKPAQGLLLAGFVALIPHTIWVMCRKVDLTTASAYESFGFWAQTLFTALGFMGTIVGVSLAIAGLEAAMAANDPAALITGLSTAFDTTFIGLVSAVLLMATRKVVTLCAKL